MGLAEDDRPFSQETRLSSFEQKDDESVSSKEVSLSKENKEDGFTEHQEQGSESPKICLVLVPLLSASPKNVLVLVLYFSA